MRFWSAIGGIFLFTLVACSEPPRIDTTSEKAWGDSVPKVYVSLPQSQQEQFAATIGACIFKATGQPFLKAKVDQAALERLKVLNGKTGAEVLAQADSLKDQVQAAPSAN